MMEYLFRPSTFRDLLHRSIDSYLVNGVPDGDVHAPFDLVAAMEQAIDVMARVDADIQTKSSLPVNSMRLLEEKNITEIGRYALDLLAGLVSFVEEKTGQPDRDLLRLSIPLSLWVARHQGRLYQIDMVVNSLAGFANDLKQPESLAELANIMGEVIDACSDEIKHDQDKENLMRPWRILNLNHGIVATRSHDPVLIEKVYDVLIKNLPQDARQFFHEGWQQMEIIGYPASVREVVERYNRMWGAQNQLH